MLKDDGSHAKQKTSTTGKCSEDPNEVCTRFFLKSAFAWQKWIVDASGAYFDCCSDTPQGAPSIPTKPCKDHDDCEDVCETFRDWAKEIRKWALEFTKDVDKCFADWKPKEKVPDVPSGNCKECKDVCAAIDKFHAEMEVWGDDVRYPLNNICAAPGPERVPPPPTPPPFG